VNREEMNVRSRLVGKAVLFALLIESAADSDRVADAMWIAVWEPAGEKSLPRTDPETTSK